jgi:transcriptional regulator with XRE-family HTH domain
MSENERLKEIRKSLELTQREFSDALDIKQGSYSDVERGKAGISAVLLKNLIRRFRINPLWLCEGEGAMFIDKPDDISKFPPNRVSKSSGIPLQKSVDKNYLSELQEQVEQLEVQQDNLENLKSIIEFLKKGE